MKFWVGVTDNDWFSYLAERKPDEVNFWNPGGTRASQTIEAGAPYLFKLHSPLDFIVGGGFFLRYSVLPLSIAWECFGDKNGASSLEEVRRLIQRRRKSSEQNPHIGCTVLAEPFFFQRQDWIPVPSDWKKNIVRGKTYDMIDSPGRELWAQVERLLARESATGESPISETDMGERYGRTYLARARLGQGGFRVLVTEAYNRRCAVTCERTLPVLQAAHIKPFSQSGPHRVNNGLLLRSDLHILFDKGYLTVTPDLHVEVSRRIRDEYENGRDYYAFHGQALAVLPKRLGDRPAPAFLRWHNEKAFLS
jgi:putative restriction endonuclease